MPVVSSGSSGWVSLGVSLLMLPVGATWSSSMLLARSPATCHPFHLIHGSHRSHSRCLKARGVNQAISKADRMSGFYISGVGVEERLFLRPTQSPNRIRHLWSLQPALWVPETLQLLISKHFPLPGSEQRQRVLCCVLISKKGKSLCFVSSCSFSMVHSMCAQGSTVLAGNTEELWTVRVCILCGPASVLPAKQQSHCSIYGRN